MSDEHIGGVLCSEGCIARNDRKRWRPECHRSMEIYMLSPNFVFTLQKMFMEGSQWTDPLVLETLHCSAVNIVGSCMTECF